MKVVSGGQTGVDRAALDVCRDLGIPTGGWCPRGRRAEDGRIPAIYELKEATSPNYEVRTEWNVRDSDASLVISSIRPTGGTLATLQFAERHSRPFLLINPKVHGAPERVLRWLDTVSPVVLNVAGPRQSEVASAYQEALELLYAVLTHVRR